MRSEQALARERLREHFAMSGVECLYRGRVKRGANADAGTNPSAPAFRRVWHFDVVREGLETAESRGVQMRQTPWMEAIAALELPLRVVLLDQLLGRVDDAARVRQPVEMRNEDVTA